MKGPDSKKPPEKELQMNGLGFLIKIATILAMLAIASGHLNQIVDAVRTEQVQLIEQSKASRW